MDSFEIVMHAERPDLADTSIAFDGENYPAFIEEDAVWHEVSPSFYEEFSKNLYLLYIIKLRLF